MLAHRLWRLHSIHHKSFHWDKGTSVKDELKTSLPASTQGEALYDLKSLKLLHFL